MTTTSAVEDQGVAAVEPPAPEQPAGQTFASRLRDLPGRTYTAVQNESILVAVLVSSFIARWLIADRNSYWLDELLSVSVYGIWNDSATAAVDRLARASVHPLSYQLTLYYWMELFGDGERATRSLSNLYIVLATLFLYLLVRDAFSRRVALLSAVAFALMYTPMYYALETRSYAQTIFLVTLSSYALLRMLRRGADHGWRASVLSPTAALFAVANVGLLLTHYYNFFFWVAQALLAGLFVLREARPRRWVAGLVTIAAMYALQGILFTLVWGRELWRDIRRRGGAFPVEEDGLRNPFELLGQVVTPNLDPPTLVWWAGLAVFGVLVVRALAGLVRSGPTTARLPAWNTVYLVTWLVLPVIVVYVAFLITGIARYAPRYWLFIMPPLAPLVILTAEEGVRLAGRAWRRGRELGSAVRWSTVVALAVIATLIVPGTLAAATHPKEDWRGTAQDIVDIVEADPDSSYVIYEPSFRPSSLLDYHLSRYSDDIRVTGTIQRFEERTKEIFRFERDADLIEQHDFLVLPFTYQRTGQFPRALEKLTSTYPVHYWQIDELGRGLIILSVSPAPGEPATPS